MAFPPINIFSQHNDPEGTLSKLLELVPDAKVSRYPGGAWHQVHFSWKRGWLKKPLTMVANHDPEYYSGENWQTQLAGMRGYFGTFEKATTRPDLFEYLPGLAFSFNFMLDPDPEDEDPRLDIVFEMARHVDGIVFLPGRLLDSSGRIIVSADGENDEEAQLPAHTPVTQDERSQANLESQGDSEEEDISSPPPLERILRRFLLMTALVQRGFMENSETDDAMRQDIVGSLQGQDIWEEAETWEAETLETPIGALDEKRQWKLCWLSEGTVVLAWALGLAELPAYDQEVDVTGLYAMAAALQEGTLSANPRSSPEIETLADQMLTIHWRLRQFSLDGKAMDFVAFAPKAWWGPMDLSLARLIHNDLEVNGHPLSTSPEEAWKRASGILEERRTAINWLLGQSIIYSETDTAT